MIITEKYIKLDKQEEIKPIVEHFYLILNHIDWVNSKNYTEDFKPYILKNDIMYLAVNYLSLVLDVFKIKDIVYTCKDFRKHKAVPLKLPHFPFELYDYQTKIINTVLNSHYPIRVKGVDSVRNTGIINFDTNAGKTEVIAAIANSHKNHFKDDSKIIIVSYDGQGAAQTQQRLEQYKVTATLVKEIKDTKATLWKVSHLNMVDTITETININDKVASVSLGRIIILTIDQIKIWASRIKNNGWKFPFKLRTLLWDEPDLITFKTLQAVTIIQKNINYFDYSFGFTGTYELIKPHRQLMVSQVVGSLFGDSVKYKELNNLGQSSDVEVVVLKIPKFDEGFNTMLNKLYELKETKNYLVNEFSKKYKDVPYQTKNNYFQQGVEILTYFDYLSGKLKKNFYLKLFYFINKLIMYKVETNILFYNKTIITNIINTVLDIYKIEWEKDNTLGLLINCFNEVEAINLMVDCINSYNERNSINMTVKAGHTKAGDLSKIKEQFQKQEFNILVTSSVKHGLNHRNLFGLVNFTGKATDKFRQLLGRIERINKLGTPTKYIDIDLFNYNFRFYPNHLKERIEMCEEIGYKIIN